jgi:hypothetical protein
MPNPNPHDLESIAMSVPVPASSLLSRSLVVAALAVGAVGLGWVPSLPGSLTARTVQFEAVAFAQDFSADDIEKFVKANLAIEAKRLQTLRDISTQMQGRATPIACHDAASLNALPVAPRDVAVNYCNEAKKIVANQGLTTERFNQILVQMRQDETVRKRIEAAACRIQPKMQMCQH